MMANVGSTRDLLLTSVSKIKEEIKVLEMLIQKRVGCASNGMTCRTRKSRSRTCSIWLLFSLWMRRFRPRINAT